VTAARNVGVILS